MPHYVVEDNSMAPEQDAGLKDASRITPDTPPVEARKSIQVPQLRPADPKNKGETGLRSETSETGVETRPSMLSSLKIESKASPSPGNTVWLSDQELIDSALDYCQVSNDFWEQGDLDNAIEALDKAYSLTLKVNGENSPELQQQKEDLRYTISKRIIEVYSSRFTVANGTHKEIPLYMNQHVQKALDLLKGRERNFFLTSYARSGMYRPAILKALKEAGLPEELSWLPLIESGFKVRALSSARALGMWQFIASTGYKYGLKRDTWIDERMDPEKSTKAAIAYLSELHQIFGDWTTVLASYNCGEGRVLNLIRSQKINYLDNFWDLYEKLPSETAFYVPKFLAVLHILNDPRAHGFDLPPLEKELEYEEVTINKTVHLKTIAKGLDIREEILEDLNPELRQDITPKTAYSLKVPPGKGEVLLAKLEDIPAWRPPVPSYVVHSVKSGETLSVLAHRYGTTIDAIMAMNGLKSKNYVKVGWKLKIPTSKSYIPSVKAGSGSPVSSKTALVKYTVKNGDSLWKIAKDYNTTVNAIKSLNQMRSTTLKIGQVLNIPTSVTASSTGATQKYMVKKGDSPYLIAKRYKMNLHEFLKINDLTPRSTIFPGQMVDIMVE
ncbi:MAG: LysM peptidoglycan-binding domain-containing protein [Deltaproteobacteria bacterium]|nr:LysM peptidoglycan-binding domain-containing protein [Deltaproteobacteria bacterium]